MTSTVHAGYRACARLTWRYGTTYFWGAAILPRRQRRDVHAVYALCRRADDIIDLGTADPQLRDHELTRFQQRFVAAVDGAPDDPVLAAIGHTVRSRGIAMECFDRFFTAMRMDLIRDRYQSWADLCDYMEGSAAVIGEMMLPILEPRHPAARDPARALGLAFQLTNFLRDVDEDLDRGRIYLPQEDLERFDVDLRSRTVTPSWRRLMQFEIARNRRLYRQAEMGIGWLPAASARCVAVAHRLYGRILDRIEAVDYDVFSGRVAVPTSQKAAHAARMLITGATKTGSSMTRSP